MGSVIDAWFLWTVLSRASKCSFILQLHILLIKNYKGSLTNCVFSLGVYIRKLWCVLFCHGKSEYSIFYSSWISPCRCFLARLLELLLCCCHCLGDKSQAVCFWGLVRASQSLHQFYLASSSSVFQLSQVGNACSALGKAQKALPVRGRLFRRGSWCLRSDWKQLPGVITGLWIL